MKPLFLITDKVPDGFLESFETLGFEVDYQQQISNEKLADTIHIYNGMVVNTSMRLDAEMLSRGRQLKYILRPGSGLDNIDVSFAASHDIRVFSSPEANRDAVGEHAIGLLISLLRHIPKADKEVKHKEWIRHANTGVEIKGKTVGIIGFGNTGSGFAKKLQGFEAELLVYDKYRKDFGIPYIREVSLEEIQEKADILSLHVPLTTETHHLINDDFIGCFKKNFYLVNTSRGGVVDIKSICKALSSNKLRGAALDVLENEKISSYSTAEMGFFEELVSYDNVVLTPHIAGWSQEARANIFWLVLEKFKSWLQSAGHAVPNLPE
jgi:D-3-phosphoglycerate dehydrogenase